MKIKSGPLKGKEINFAPGTRVEAVAEVAEEFMFEIFGFEPGEYLITDESSLADFTEAGSSDTGPLWRRVEERYGMGSGDVASDRLVDLFETIAAKNNPH